MANTSDETEQLYRRFREWADEQYGEEDRLAVMEAILNGSARVTMNAEGELKYVPLDDVYQKPST